MTCTFADDAYLISRWPQVVVSTPGVWLVTVVAVSAGDYTITVGGVPYVYTADGTETAGDIRGFLLLAVSTSLAVTSSPTGSAMITMIQVQAAALTVTVSGPGLGDITIDQTAGSDNTAQRTIWLDAAKCGVIACCYFEACGSCGGPSVDCTSDFTLYHASLAAHMLILNTSMGPSGFSAASFQSMTLGPASLTKGKTGYVSPVEEDLARTEPGRLCLMLRRRYLPFAMCG